MSSNRYIYETLLIVAMCIMISVIYGVTKVYIIDKNQIIKSSRKIEINRDSVPIPQIPISVLTKIKPQIKYVKRYIHDTIQVRDSVPVLVHDTIIDNDTIYFRAFPSNYSTFDYWNFEYNIKKKPNYLIKDSITITDSIFINTEKPYTKWLYFVGGALVIYGGQKLIKQ